METIGFIGLGAMGLPMALNLLQHGCGLRAYDLRPEAGAQRGVRDALSIDPAMVSRSGYARIATLLRKYADLDPDWADVALVWLAETTSVTRIVTLDVADFSVYRIHGRKRFELELLR